MTLRQLLAAGCALFTMLFGAGNIIFPLILGRTLGNTTAYAMVGFILTGVLIPLLGFVSVTLAKGDYALFLRELGRVPAFIIATLCMALLGPLGAIPRCIAIAYADLAWYLPDLSMPLFSGGIALVIWLCTATKSNVIHLLGRVLGPIKVICLLSLVFLGLFWPGEIQVSSSPVNQSFAKGLLSGYATMDLLAIVFFSQLIFSELTKGQNEVNFTDLKKNALKASFVCGILMTIVYIGFAAIAAIHGSRVKGIADDTLLSALATTILGSRAGLFANITIILTCLTTSIALTATFADFLSRFVMKNSISYKNCLIMTILSSAFLSNLKFSGIMSFLMPWISLIYPALAIYSFLHVFAAWKQKKAIYAPLVFFATVMVVAVFNYLL